MIDNGLDDAEALAVDGKSLQGIHGERLPGVHLVSAFGHRSGVVIGEKAVGSSGEQSDMDIADVLGILGLARLGTSMSHSTNSSQRHRNKRGHFIRHNES